MFREDKLVEFSVCPTCFDYLKLRDIVTSRRGKVATCKCTGCGEVWDMLLFIMPTVGTSVDNKRDLSTVKTDTDVLDADILRRKDERN